MYKYIRLPFLFAILVLSSCSTVNYIPAETAKYNTRFYASTSKSSPNSIKIYMKPPIGREYTILGLCRATSMKGMVTYEDGSQEAFKALKACACRHGGNAVIVEGKEEVIVTPTGRNSVYVPHQQEVTISGTVVYLMPL